MVRVREEAMSGMVEQAPTPAPASLLSDVKILAKLLKLGNRETENSAKAFSFVDSSECSDCGPLFLPLRCSARRMPSSPQQPQEGNGVAVLISRSYLKRAELMNCELLSKEVSIK